MQRKYPTPVQFVLACPAFWRGGEQTQSRAQQKCVKWHYDSLFPVYRSWAQSQGIETKYIGKDWTYLVGHLKNLGIRSQDESTNKGRVTIGGRRGKGFSIETATLVQNIKDFLKKAGQDDDECDFEPPREGFALIETTQQSYAVTSVL